MVSAHWLKANRTMNSGAQPELIFNYYGFPPHTYELRYPAPGNPQLCSCH